MFTRQIDNGWKILKYLLTKHWKSDIQRNENEEHPKDCDIHISRTLTIIRNGKHMTSKGTQWPLYALKGTGRKEFEKKKVWDISGLANNIVEVEETSRPAYFEQLSEGSRNYIR